MLRQLGIICASILLAGILLHRQIASALLARGDDILRRNHPLASLSYYRRALFFQPNFSNAIDRITLIALLTHDRTAMEIALHLTRAIQARYPRDATIAFDRGLIALRAHALGEARDAFERAGALRHDWQSYAFASFLDRRLGDFGSARRDWHLVATFNPHFARFHDRSRHR